MHQWWSASTTELIHFSSKVKAWRKCALICKMSIKRKTFRLQQRKENPGNYPWNLPWSWMFPLGWAGKPDFFWFVKKTSHGGCVEGSEVTAQPSSIEKKKEKTQLGSALNLHPVGGAPPTSSKLGTLGVTGCHWVSLRFGRRTDTQDGRVCHFMCVCVGGGLTHTRCAPSQLTVRICLRGTSPPRPIHHAAQIRPAPLLTRG